MGKDAHLPDWITDDTMMMMQSEYIDALHAGEFAGFRLFSYLSALWFHDITNQ